MGDNGRSCRLWGAPRPTLPSAPSSGPSSPEPRQNYIPPPPVCQAVTPPGLQKRAPHRASCHFLSPSYASLRWVLLFFPF